MILDLEIIAIGRLRKDYFRQAWDSYFKMISPYARLKLTELSAESFVQGQHKKALKKESEKIGQILNSRINRAIFILDEKGKEFTSEAFAEKIKLFSDRGVSFVIGGSLGFDEDFKKFKYPKISLSKMTLPHEMARVILIEQLYRSITINRNKSYHY